MALSEYEWRVLAQFEGDLRQVRLAPWVIWWHAVRRYWRSLLAVTAALAIIIVMSALTVAGAAGPISAVVAVAATYHVYNDRARYRSR